MWELAVYLKIRKNPKVVFISIEKRIAEIVTIVVMTLLQLGIDVTTDVEDKFFFMFFSSKFDVLRLNFAKSGQKSTLEHQNRCLKALFKF